MEVLEKGKTISIHPGQKLPISRMLVDAGGVLALIWGVFAVLVLFFSQAGREILPYFIAITLLLLGPFVGGILIRQSRQYSTILFDGESGMLSVKGFWGSWRVPFDEIREFQVNKYRFKRNILLYRLEVLLSSGKILRLVQDVPDKGSLRSLAEKLADLVKKPLNVHE